MGLDDDLKGYGGKTGPSGRPYTRRGAGQGQGPRQYRGRYGNVDIATDGQYVGGNWRRPGTVIAALRALDRDKLSAEQRQWSKDLEKFLLSGGPKSDRTPRGQREGWTTTVPADWQTSYTDEEIVTPGIMGTLGRGAADGYAGTVKRFTDMVDGPRYAPNDPRGYSQAPGQTQTGPWSSGQFTAGYQPPPEEPDLWDEYFDFQEKFIKEGAETTRTTIKDYQDFGLEQLGLDESALGVQIDEREAQTVGLMQEQEEVRRADYEMLTEGQGGDVSAQNIYLAELGIDDPELFTTEPANESTALLGASYRAGAEVGRVIQHQVNFAANSLNSIVASGFSQSRQDLLFNVMQQGVALDKYVSENLAKVELARMQKKIDDEQAADEAKALADYAVELVPMLGLHANLILAMEKYDILDPFVDQLWAPDEEQYYSVDPMNPNQELSNDQIASNLDIYKKFLDIIGTEEELKGMHDYDIRR